MFVIKFLKAFLLASALIMAVNTTYSQDEFFYLDYGIFKGNDNKAIIEVYYSFDQRNLMFIKNDAGYEAKGKIELKISNTASGKMIINEVFNVPVAISDTAGYNKNNRLVGQLNVELDSGSYFVDVTGSDLNNDKIKMTDTVTFRLGRFSSEKLAYSSIQLANNIYKSDDKSSIFYKNSLEVEPNPSRLFGNNIKKIFYYAELYNLSEGIKGEEFTVNTTLMSPDNLVIKDNKKEYNKNFDSKVEMGTFDIAGLPSGKYSIRMIIANKDDIFADVSKIFYIYNADTKDVISNMDNIDNDYLLSDISKLSKDQLIYEYERSRYILSDNFKEKFEQLKDFEAQKKYYFTFWKSMDTRPETPFNEAKKEYFDKVQYADKNLKSDLRQGWETDRGRVYISLGKPSEIERFPFEANTRAYEIWRYDNIEGGVEFVFVDISNDGGNYELVHSTKRNELRNDDWKSRFTIIR